MQLLCFNLKSFLLNFPPSLSLFLKPHLIFRFYYYYRLNRATASEELREKTDMMGVECVPVYKLKVHFPIAHKHIQSSEIVDC